MKTNVTNPFDPASLAIESATLAEYEAVEVNKTIRVMKPHKQWFIRTHPAKTLQVATTILELSGESTELFLILPHMRAALEGDVSPVKLFTSITRYGQVFLWPVKLPSGMGRISTWTESAISGAERAQTKWVRIISDMTEQKYRIREALEQTDEPKWPEDLSLQLLLEQAFKGRVIDSEDHPAIKRLRGEL